MLKNKLFVSALAAVLVLGGMTACSDNDDGNGSAEGNTYDFTSLYGKTFAYSGTTSSGSAMTQTVTVTDSENISWSMSTAAYTHGFEFTDCAVENTAADEWTVTGSYTYNGAEASVTMVFNLTDSFTFNWTYNGKTYEGFELAPSTFYGTYTGTWNINNNDYAMTVIVAENVLYYSSSMMTGSYEYVGWEKDEDGKWVCCGSHGESGANISGAATIVTFDASTMKGAFSVTAMSSMASPAELTRTSTSVDIPSDSVE
ncbi:hypothetical protein [Treponema sp.]|jgi:hypothetical protein|uniref:hypothetical protein n=1 Tax=Treponema sp. TaxID=166 RepID=UPI0025796756|nr:hypothetical protein [Treponema sp.]MBE6354221.1 hypothetical protein [Treponema sp.]